MPLQLVTGKQIKPQRVVIYAPEGIGKSTFASQFPKPLFIDIEGGTSTLDVARAPKASSWAMFKEQLKEIKADPMGFATLVIDTADWAERLCLQHICDSNNWASIEEPGYGKGFVRAGEEWGKFLDFLTDLSTAAGMNVVVLAHAHLKKFEQPDESGAYDRYEMKLSKYAAPLLKEWADMVLFCNYETIVVQDANTKTNKAQGGKRVIHTTHHVCWDAKNRHDLPAKLDFPKAGAFEQIGHCFPAVGGASSTSTEAAPLEARVEPGPPSDDVPADFVAQPDPADAVHANQPAPAAEPTGTKVPFTDPTAFPAALFELMHANQVQEAEIQQVVAAKGYYPADTPVGNYADDFVAGVLVAAWEQVFNAIKSNRKEKAA
ncbi:hypothetical protein PDESU_03338 [Pontiella desulfatans]|uniref:ATP-binding protein n=1 Tax=Pontiella desulfatans TaxID=2750659 RepID=A0A6C2U4L2_PONDE|nr:ATP-binding protein [Pontiella desulfatans]VGO14769.1 hypothetical protein PDESU_03338 [Pontiella desulfatans]